MTLGRCSRRGPAEAVTPAIIPSDASAPAKACAVGASSFARLAATNTVTPELGESGMPAGGSPTERPDGATLTQFAKRSALSSSSHNGRASSDPGATWPSNSWPANFCTAEATRRSPSGVSVRGVFNLASSSSVSRARSRASERSALLPKRATPRPASTTAMKSKASSFCSRRLRSRRRMTATVPISPIANSAWPQLRQNSGSAIPRKRSLMRGGSRRSLAGVAEAARAARRVARQRQKAVQLGEQQRADVELGEKHAAFDQARNLGRRDELHADARLRLERAGALAGLDEEIVDAVVEASGAGGVLAERVNGARGEAGLFHELAPAAVGRVFAGIDQARRQLPRERFERGAVLPHDRDFSAARERDDRDVIGLLDSVIGLRRRAARKLHLARDDAHPRRHRRGAARAYARPFHGDDPKPGKLMTLERLVVAWSPCTIRSSPRKRGPSFLDSRLRGNERKRCEVAAYSQVSSPRLISAAP